MLFLGLHTHKQLTVTKEWDDGLHKTVPVIGPCNSYSLQQSVFNVGHIKNYKKIERIEQKNVGKK